MELLDCDLLVIGGGMAGLTVAARAADSGATVVVAEKTDRLGGNAIISNGYVWTCASERQLAQVDADVLPLGGKVVADFAKAMEWLRGRGVFVSPPATYFTGYGYNIDVAGFVKSCETSVARAGGHVVTRTVASRLLAGSGGAATGAILSHEDGDVEVKARCILLATGGMQGDPSLLERFIGPGAAKLKLRSSPASSGDGLRLAAAFGAATTEPAGGFYGHLAAAPAELSDHAVFVGLTPYHSDRSLLLDRSGRRLFDESEGDNINALELFHSGSEDALLLWDEQVEDNLRHATSGVPMSGKVEYARRRGADAALCNSLEDVGRVAAKWGFDGDRAVRTIGDYNAACGTAPEGLRPPRMRHAVPVSRPPFYMMRVTPAVTFAYGGIAADIYGRVLDTRGEPIPGLYAAGVDVGDVWRRGYAGGLAIALVLGLAAAQSALARLGERTS